MNRLATSAAAKTSQSSIVIGQGRRCCQSFASARTPSSVVGSARVSGCTRVAERMSPATPISRMRAKSGVVERCGHSALAMAPVSAIDSRLAIAESRRGHHSSAPNRRQPPMISQSCSGATCGVVSPLRSGTQPPACAMCQAEARVSSSIGAVGGRPASAPAVTSSQRP